MALSRLEQLAGEMKKCFRCSLCKMVPLPTVRDPRYSNGCPASRQLHFHGYSGSGKSIMALSLLEGRIQVDAALAEITYACTTCGLCDTACKFIMEAERHQVNMALREHIAEEGFAPAVHRETVENLARYGSPDGEAPGPALDWAAGLALEDARRRKAPVLLFAGCGARRDPDAAQVARKLALLLRHAGVDFAVLGAGERCCGLPAYWTGFRDAFAAVAADTGERFAELGASTIVTASGCCLGAMRSKYPEYGAAPPARVLHASELLAQLIDAGSLRLPRPLRRAVTYHDPCYLGRQSEPPLSWEGEYKTTHGCMTYADPPREINRGVGGVFEEPRRILAAIDALDFVEMARIREYAFCCGGGGGVPRANPKLAHATALHRLEEAADAGADTLATACHHCRANLSRAQRDAQDDAQRGAGKALPPVVDIVDLVYEAAGLES